ncbi:MAG: hypothetical protein KKA73_25510 [Chloroflexi bacterium]|nr:hypothetical protein [Chloroflexota bacterium]
MTETRVRVRKVTWQTAALQVNIATAGRQQVTVAGGDVNPGPARKSVEV